jgi:hypothetical protein
MVSIMSDRLQWTTIVACRVEDHGHVTPRDCSDRRDAAGRIRAMRTLPSTAAERRRAERDAPTRTADDQTVLVGMNRPATPAELRAFIAREQARIRTERGLTPAA